MNGDRNHFQEKQSAFYKVPKALQVNGFKTFLIGKVGRTGYAQKDNSFSHSMCESAGLRISQTSKGKFSSKYPIYSNRDRPQINFKPNLINFVLTFMYSTIKKLRPTIHPKMIFDLAYQKIRKTNFDNNILVLLSLKKHFLKMCSIIIGSLSTTVSVHIV